MTRESSAGRLANKFILVSNLVAPDGGAAIAAGNGRVVRARLADARHFWQTDLAPLPDAKDKSAKPLDQRLEKLDRGRLSREARDAGRADRAHRGAGARACAQGRRRPRRLRRARRISPRPISRPKWSASSLSFRDSWAATTRSRRASRARSPTRSRSITSRKGRTTASRLRRSRSRSRSPTSSTRSSASGRSTRSRPAARTLTRCRRAALGVIRIVLENGLQTASRSDACNLLHLSDRKMLLDVRNLRSETAEERSRRATRDDADYARGLSDCQQ